MSRSPLHFRTCDVRQQFNDLLTVYDGAQADALVISRFCGHHSQQEVMSTSRSMLITFSSNSFANMQGFAAIFKFVKFVPGMSPITYMYDIIVTWTPVCTDTIQ